MTFDQLHSIMYSLPDEVRANILRYLDAGSWTFWYDDHTIPDGIGEDVMISQMMQWLSKDRSVCVCGQWVKVGSPIVPWSEWDSYKKDTLIESLADACKAVFEKTAYDAEDEWDV